MKISEATDSPCQTMEASSCEMGRIQGANRGQEAWSGLMGVDMEAQTRNHKLLRTQVAILDLAFLKVHDF